MVIGKVDVSGVNTQMCTDGLPPEVLAHRIIHMQSVAAQTAGKLFPIPAILFEIQFVAEYIEIGNILPIEKFGLPEMRLFPQPVMNAKFHFVHEDFSRIESEIRKYNRVQFGGIETANF